MNCCGWSCRGIGNAATVHDLCVLQRTHRFRLIFLCETRQKSDRVRRLGLRGFEGVDSDAMSGGLVLFWHESVHVEIREANSRFIDAFVCFSAEEPLFHATFVYGEPRVENRHRMWLL
jgi:hypothetical protein